jgi:hypothetical protein
MRAVVVYESLWSNTAAIARAIAEGIGPTAQALSTAEASVAAVANVDLIVAGAPVLGFRLPTDAMRQSVLTSERNAPLAPDLSHPSMRSWLETLPRGRGRGRGRGRSAAFETRIWWSPGGVTGAIADKLAQAGYPPLRKARRFVVKGKYGPLRDGEIDRARRWGAELAEAMR